MNTIVQLQRTYTKVKLQRMPKDIKYKVSVNKVKFQGLKKVKNCQDNIQKA